MLRWNIQRGVVVIPKSTHIEGMEENFAVFDFVLSDEDMTAIAVSYTHLDVYKRQAQSQEEAAGMIHPVEEDIRKRFGSYVFGADGDTLEAVSYTHLGNRDLRDVSRNYRAAVPKELVLPRRCVDGGGMLLPFSLHAASLPGASWLAHHHLCCGCGGNGGCSFSYPSAG